MYNEEIKQRFFNENPEVGPGSKGNRMLIFDSVSSYEKAAGKDIAQMDIDELVEVIKAAGITEQGSLNSYISFLKRYFKWCESSNAMPGVSSGLTRLKAQDVDISGAIGQVLFKDENDLLDSIALVRSFDEGYVDVPVLVLGWLGLSREEISALRDWNVNITDRIISAPDGSVIASGFSDRIADVLERYRKCLVSERENNVCAYEVIKDRSVDSFLKRMAPRDSKKLGTEFSKLQIDTALSKLAVRYEELGHPRRHTFTNVWRSGRFHALWELEQAGVDIIAKDNRPLVESTMRGKKNYYNAIKMYQAYKKAFYE